MADRRNLLTWGLPVLVVMVAMVVTAIVVSRPAEQLPAVPTTTEVGLEPVRITSDAPSYGSLGELLDASDVVVRAEVTAVERGRWFGDGQSGSGVQSRLVTLEVAEVLVGEVPPGDLGSIVVEEEGWLEDGAPLVVDGAAPSAAGDDGIWFLVDPGDDTTDVLILVNAQGRYLVSGDGLRGASGNDPLVADLASGSADDLANRIRTS